MADIKKEEVKSKHPTKVGIPAGVESERLQAEGWIVVRSYHSENNPLIRLYDLEQQSKN